MMWAEERVKTPWMAIGIGAIVVGVVVAVCLAVLDPRPRLKVGQVVDRVGEYRYPSGDRRLKIVEDADGNVLISEQYIAWKYGILPVRIDDGAVVFESEREWFAAVDQHERIWIYHGQWDKDWGPLRTMPSGQTAPNRPVTQVLGFFSNSMGYVSRGKTILTVEKDWSGVPPEFFNRVPDRGYHSGIRGPKIPTIPRPLTSHQENELAKALRQR